MYLMYVIQAILQTLKLHIGLQLTSQKNSIPNKLAKHSLSENNSQSPSSRCHSWRSNTRTRYSSPPSTNASGFTQSLGFLEH